MVDDSAGSVDLFPFIEKLTTEAILTRIDPPFGDVTWTADGPGNETLNIGVEYKRLDDVLDCMIDGRFVAHQLPGLIDNYQRIHLLIEMDRTRADRHTGVLQRFKGGQWYNIVRKDRGFTSRELEHWCTTIEEQAGIRVNFTYDKWDSARWLVNKHSWWVNKGWDQHQSLKQFHVKPPPFAILVKPALRCRVAKELGDVGWERAFAAAKRFGSTREMINANEQTWREVEGVGRTIAQRIIKEVTSE